MEFISILEELSRRRLFTRVPCFNVTHEYHGAEAPIDDTNLYFQKDLIGCAYCCCLLFDVSHLSLRREMIKSSELSELMLGLGRPWPNGRRADPDFAPHTSQKA